MLHKYGENVTAVGPLWCSRESNKSKMYRKTGVCTLLLSELQKNNEVMIDLFAELKEQIQTLNKLLRQMLSWMPHSLADLPDFYVPLSWFYPPDLLKEWQYWWCPNEPGAHPISIHLCSLLLMSLKHQNNGINLLELDISAEERGEMCGSARCGLICVVLSTGLCPCNPKGISRIINLDKVPTFLH